MARVPPPARINSLIDTPAASASPLPSQRRGSAGIDVDDPRRRGGVANGRFSSRDLLFGEPTDPISLNQFAYGAANPVTFSDPSGLRVTSGGGTDSGNDCEMIDLEALEAAHAPAVDSPSQVLPPAATYSTVLLNEDLPLEERLQAAEFLIANYGEHGQEIVDNWLRVRSPRYGIGYLGQLGRVGDRRRRVESRALRSQCSIHDRRLRLGRDQRWRLPSGRRADGGVHRCSELGERPAIYSHRRKRRVAEKSTVPASELTHETKHADQWAIFGWTLPGSYWASEAVSQVAGRGSCWNIFEYWAGFEGGSYTTCVT